MPQAIVIVSSWGILQKIVYFITYVVPVLVYIHGGVSTAKRLMRPASLLTSHPPRAIFLATPGIGEPPFHQYLKLVQCIFICN